MLTPISGAGYVCLAGLGFVTLIAAAVVVTASWWTVYFWDCPNEDAEVAYYMVLKRGFCVDPEQGKEDNYDECESWKDVKDNTRESDVKDAAQSYIHAYNLGNVALACAALFLVTVILQCVPVVRKTGIVRFVSMGSLLVTCFMHVGALIAASNTYFTDESNYTLAYQLCESYATFGSVGYYASVVVIFFAALCFLIMLSPCCCCAEKKEASSIDPHPSSLQQPIIGNENEVYLNPVLVQTSMVFAAPVPEAVANSTKGSGSTVSYKY